MSFSITEEATNECSQIHGKQTNPLACEVRENWCYHIPMARELTTAVVGKK
jgi:hypothetical protein